MTGKKGKGIELIPLIKQSVSTCVTNPLILLPFITIAFVQLLVIEVLYFAPRYPLSIFFEPLFKYHGDEFMHYPFNLALLPKFFLFAQIPIYILISSFFISVAITTVAAINSGSQITFGSAIRQTGSRYVHIVVGAFIAFLVYFGLLKLFGLVVTRASIIRSTTGLFFILKSIIIHGAPYFQILISVLATSLFAFLYPIVVLDKKNVFAAIVLNFKRLWSSCWFIFLVVLIPTLFYVPVLLVRNNVALIAETTFPGVRILILVLSIIVTVTIDAIVYTAVTTFYLVKKEE